MTHSRRSGLKDELTKAEREMLADIAEGRFTSYYMLSKGQKFVATALQQRGLIETGKKERRVPLALTDEGKREAQRYLLAR